MKKNGFTLVEIIVALGVLGILSLGTATVLGNNFTFLRESRNITEDTFLSQQDIELEMSALKTQLKSPSHGLTLGSVTIDGVSVQYYEVSKTYNGDTYQFRVTPQQYPEYVLLKTFNVDATLKSNNINTFALYPIASSSIVGSNTPDASTYSTHWMMDVYQWYVSRPGFNTPVPKGPANDATFKFYDYLVTNSMEFDIGTRYPVFPDDYVLIGTATTSTLPDVTNYAGRHLVFKVTPAAKSGRLGIPEYSDPVYIQGLANTSNLAVHLDANTLDASYKDTSNVAHIDANKKVIKWFDLSSGINVALPSQSANAASESVRPLLVDTTIGTEYSGRFVRFDASKQLILSGQGTNGKYVYGFVVVKGTEGSIIFTNGTQLDGNPRQIKRSASATEIQNGWMLEKFNYRSNNDSFTIGGSNIDVAEIVIYAFDSPLDTTQIVDLEAAAGVYLSDKYVPLDTVVEIDHLIDQNISVFQNEVLTAPSSVPALLMNGLNRYVPVTWPNSGVIDTSQVGTWTITGHATSDASKIVSYIVEVKPVPVTSVSLTPATLTLIEGGATSNLTPTVLPANATYPQITWTTIPSNSAVASVTNGVVTPLAPGTVTIRATSISDNTKYGEAIITVIPDPIIIQAELNAALSSISTLTVNYPTNKNNSNPKPTIVTPPDNYNGNGITYTFTDSSADGNAYIDISGIRKSATVNRRSNSERIITITLTALKGTQTSSKIFKVKVPSNNSAGPVTVYL